MNVMCLHMCLHVSTCMCMHIFVGLITLVDSVHMYI